MSSTDHLILDGLEKIGRLKSEGLITQNEFDEAKLNLLRHQDNAILNSDSDVPNSAFETNEELQYVDYERRSFRPILTVCLVIILLGIVGSIYVYISHENVKQSRLLEEQEAAQAEQRSADAQEAERKSSEQKAEAESQAAAQAVAAEQQAAQSQSAQADLEGAQAEHNLDEQSLNESWRLISSDRRSQILPLQRAWIKKRAADCVLESSSATNDPIVKEATRLKCESRLARERVNWMSQYASSEGSGLNPDSIMTSNQM